MKKVNEMTGNEKIAYKNVKGVFNWEVGGWYNALQDDIIESIPSTIEEAKECIYRQAMTDAAGAGFYKINGAPKEMRFAGKEFVMECIDYLFSKDGDAQEINEEVWSKTEATEEIEETEEVKEEPAKVEIPKAALKRYNDLMETICWEHSTIGTQFSESTDGWNLRDMVSETQYALDMYNDPNTATWQDAHAPASVQGKDRPQYWLWKQEMRRMERFIARYKDEAMTMECTSGHCSKFD